METSLVCKQTSELQIFFAGKFRGETDSLKAHSTGPPAMNYYKQ